MKNSKKISIVVIIFVLTFAMKAQAREIELRGDAHMPRLGVKASSSINIDTTDLVKAKTKADEAITKRINSLNKTAVRVDEMRRVSTETKTALKTNIQTEISNLSALKIKIDADTDVSILKTDLVSIVNGFRIYTLVIPQGAILAASDRAQTIIEQMNILGTKIQARISAAQAAGKDVSSLQSTYADFTSKVSAANGEATAAVNATASLSPDNGNQAAFNANEAALQDAKGNIKTAEQDLQAARKDISTLLKELSKIV